MRLHEWLCRKGIECSVKALGKPYADGVISDIRLLANGGWIIVIDPKPEGLSPNSARDEGNKPRTLDVD